MSVRVVAKVRCDSGCVEEKLFDIADGTPYSRFLSPATRQFCGVCHGTGTVERECRCDGCKWSAPDGWCPCIQRDVNPDWACMSWEPRE